MTSAAMRRLLAAVCLSIVAPLARAQPVTILSPQQNSTVDTPAIYVSGTVVSKTRQIGISVNGLRGELDLDHAGTASDPFRWFATVPSVAGRVKLAARLNKPGKKATGSDDAGNASSVVHVDYAPGREVALVPSARQGVIPLRVTFDLVHELTSPVTRFEADLDGNGSYEQVSTTEPALLERTYTSPGLVVPAIRITTADGAVTVAKTGVTPQSYSTVNGVIKEVWRGFTDALARGDVAGANLYFAAGSPRKKYAPILELIRPTLKQFSGRIQKLGALSISDDVAYYLLVREENGQANGHYVYFGRDADGLWKILQM